MFTMILWTGTALGLAAGLLHATQIVTSGPTNSSPNEGIIRIYRAVWAVGLWTLFGAYLLILWLLALVLRLAFTKRATG